MISGMWITIGALSAFVAVAAGAFGAHGLKDNLAPEALAIWETAARYQMYHALALCIVGLLSRSRVTRFAGGAFLFGTLVFSGTLYALALTGQKWLGAITPIGGAALLGGWISLALAARSRSRG